MQFRRLGTQELYFLRLQQQTTANQWEQPIVGGKTPKTDYLGDIKATTGILSSPNRFCNPVVFPVSDFVVVQN
ncbi:MAG: hypothetical protein GPJ21_03805 [Microcystis aeruginosa W13-11]|nr:hypothetical protein [Microcystis aeruginosa W13-11]